MSYTREQLVKAMMEYNQDFLIAKEDFMEEYSSDEEFAARQVDYMLSKIPNKEDDPQCILISTTEASEFPAMGGIVTEVRELVKKYEGTFKVQYHFKSALI